jgi:hypothetical protein
VSPGVKADGGGWVITASGRIIRVPPYDPTHISAKLTDRTRAAGRAASLAIGVTALASWLHEDGHAIQKEAAKVLVESVGDIDPSRRAMGTPDPIPPKLISALVDKVRSGVLARLSSTPDPIPGVVSEIYRAMERLTADMLARQGDQSATRSATALQELSLCAAIRDLSSYMGDRGQAIERVAAKLVEQRSREVAETIE